MTRSISFARVLLALLAGVWLAGCSDSDGYDDVLRFGDTWAVTSGNRLIGFNENNPGQPRRVLSLFGLQGGEQLLAIDFRPADGRLYGLGSTGRIYQLDIRNGAASFVCRLSATGTGLSGADFGMDFNPVADRLRIVSDAEQNLRVELTAGAGGVCNTAAADSALAPAGAVVAVAYANSLAGASATTLFGIDSASDALVRIGADPAAGGACPGATGNPNCGVVTPVGSLGVDASGLAGFDIDGANDHAVAALNVGGVSQLYTINLASGAATLRGAIGGGETIRGLSRVPAEARVFGVTDTNALVSFAPGAPQTVTSVGAIAGLQAGEAVVGLDFRPADGELYALGSTGRVYRLSTATGGVVATRTLAADPADTSSPFTGLTGTAFGLDFNPVADRLRVVSEQEQNLRINVDSAQGVTTDGNLAPAGNVVAAAYTSNFDGAGATQLFVIDSGDDSLKLQNPPNDGTLVSPLPLGVAVEDSALNAFDIAGGRNGLVLAALRVGGQSNLYSVNLATGAATQITAGPIGGATPLNLRGLAIRIE